MFPPTCGTVAGAVLLIETSEVAATTVVVAEAELLPATGSTDVPTGLTVAVLVIDAGVLAVVATMTGTVAGAALARLPRLHVTVLVPEHVPCDAVAETNVTPEGSVSLTRTAADVLGPLFVAVIV